MDKKVITGIFWALAAILLFILLSGCTGEKKLLRQRVKSDSSTISSLQEENRLTKQENTRLESELKQAQYAGVVFDGGLVGIFELVKFLLK